MVKSNYKKAFILVLTLLLSVMLAVTANAGQKDKGALTPPPPPEDFTSRWVPNGADPSASPGTVTPYSMEPGQIYLSNGDNTISNNHNGTTTLSGATFATQFVDQLLVRFTLQRYTGSYWVEEYTSPSFMSYNSASAFGTINASVSNGYYYRNVSFHWVNEGNVFESGTHYGSVQLMTW